MSRYYILKAGRKAFANSMAEVQAMAQDEADRLGRAVMVYAENKTPTRKVYKSNPETITRIGKSKIPTLKSDISTAHFKRGVKDAKGGNFCNPFPAKRGTAEYRQYQRGYQSITE